MQPFRSQSIIDQLAEHLRSEIRSGGLSGEMPGVAQLVRKLGVGTTTVVGALDILKREGLLQAHGARRRCKVMKSGRSGNNGLLVRMLLYEREDARDEYTLELKHRLEQRGHRLEFATKTLLDLHFDVKRVSRLVEQSDGDAWLVRAGSREVMEWFSGRSTPSFAMFGRRTELPIARLTTLKSPAVAQAIQHLVDLGHRRIVLLTREDRRKPTPGLFERRFIEALVSHGIQTGAYNLPDWQDNPKGLHRCLDALFKNTPPTAIFLEEPALFFSTQQYLLRNRLVVPDDVSLISLDSHPSFAWFHPEVSHIHTDMRRGVRRVVQWADHVANGKPDLKETMILGTFIEGGTIGSAK